jgi:hypothetical protein
MIDRVKSLQSRALALTPGAVTETTQLTAPRLMIVTTGFEEEGNLRGIRASLLRWQNESFSIPKACGYGSRLLPDSDKLPDHSKAAPDSHFRAPDTSLIRA